jgi:hypothetical protein
MVTFEACSGNAAVPRQWQPNSTCFKLSVIDFLCEAAGSQMIVAQIVSQTTQTVTQTGIGLGSAIAVVCSWQRNRSILWANLAGIFSWFYVIYFAFTRRADEIK